MNRAGIKGRAAVFVVVVVLTVAAVAAAGVVTDQATTEKPTADADRFQPDAIETPELERGGEIAIDGDHESKTIVIDIAHDNDVSEADLQPVVSALTAHGHTVEYHEYEEQPGATGEQRALELADALRDADALIAVDPQARYTPGEAEAVSEFADAGGRVLFAGGPETGGAVVTIDPVTGQPVEESDGEFASVTSALGIAFDTGYLYDMEDYEGNYRTISVMPETDTDLTAGVDRVVFDAPTQVATEGETLLTTAETAEHSESREAGSYGVAVRHDNAVGVGDTGFMTTETHNVADNEVFIGNLLEFLVGGEKDENAPSAGDDRSAGGPGYEEGRSPTQPPQYS